MSSRERGVLNFGGKGSDLVLNCTAKNQSPPYLCRLPTTSKKYLTLLIETTAFLFLSKLFTYYIVPLGTYLLFKDAFIVTGWQRQVLCVLQHRTAQQHFLNVSKNRQKQVASLDLKLFSLIC